MTWCLSPNQHSKKKKNPKQNQFVASKWVFTSSALSLNSQLSLRSVPAQVGILRLSPLRSQRTLMGLTVESVFIGLQDYWLWSLWRYHFSTVTINLVRWVWLFFEGAGVICWHLSKVFRNHGYGWSRWVPELWEQRVLSIHSSHCF